MGIEVFGKVANILGVQEDFIRIAFMFILNITLSNHKVDLRHVLSEAEKPHAPPSVLVHSRHTVPRTHA